VFGVAPAIVQLAHYTMWPTSRAKSLPDPQQQQLPRHWASHIVYWHAIFVFTRQSIYWHVILVFTCIVLCQSTRHFCNDTTLCILTQHCLLTQYFSYWNAIFVSDNWFIDTTNLYKRDILSFATLFGPLTRHICAGTICLMTRYFLYWHD